MPRFKRVGGATVVMVALTFYAYDVTTATFGLPGKIVLFFAVPFIVGFLISAESTPRRVPVDKRSGPR